MHDHACAWCAKNKSQKKVKKKAKNCLMFYLKHNFNETKAHACFLMFTYIDKQVKHFDMLKQAR